MRYQYITTVIALLFSNSLFAQLVNIETRRMQTDSVRFVFYTDLNFSYSDTDGDYIFQLGGSLSTQFKSKDLNKIFFVIGNYNLVRSKDQDFLNNWFAHLRYNQEISELFRFEAFVQTQHNQLLEISTRNLIGAGIRLKVISKEHFRMYIGNSYMYEVEESQVFNSKFNDHRNSTYLSTTFTGKESTINLTNTIYYQPLYSDFSDYRLLEQFKVEFPVFKAIDFSLLFDYYLDAITPSGNKDYYSNIKLGIGYSFDGKKNKTSQ